MNGSMTMETAADRALKLPLESPFEPRDHHHHHRHHHHDHAHHAEHEGDELVQDGPNEQSDEESQGPARNGSEQAGHYGQQKLVSLSPPMGPSFISTNEGTPDAYNDERAALGAKKRPGNSATDPSLTAAAAAAVASIQDVWSENFSEPLPTNKEERIQQALEFMRNEKHAHAADKSIKKHSLRQIALFFQVPKSTLYDRLKNKVTLTIEDKDRIPISGSPTISNSYSVSSRAHSQQMKISLEKEELLLVQTHNLCHAMGNTLNLTHIRDFITSLVDGVSLGKKWVHNFTRRHDDSLIYGTLSSRFNVRMLNSKNCRCNFEYLWRCFVPLLQEKVKRLSQDEPFYYITKTCVHQPSMSSIFTCFEILPADMSVKIYGKPHLVIFPDYFGKSCMQRDMVNQTRAENGANFSESEAIDHEGLQESDSPMDSKVNKHEKVQKQHKIDKLNEAFTKLYASCCMREESNTDMPPLVVFEGFNDRYNWDPLMCKNMVDLGRFLAVPWNQQIFQQSISKRLINIVDNVARGSSILGVQLSEMDLALDHVDLDMEAFASELNQLLQMPTESTTASIEPREPAQDNDLNVFASTLRSPPSHDHEEENNFLTKSLQHQPHQKEQQPIETTASANIFENSTLSQLQDVINLIDTNESELYNELADPSSKATLIDIFTKIKGILPQ